MQAKGAPRKQSRSLWHLPLALLLLASTAAGQTPAAKGAGQVSGVLLAEGTSSKLAYGKAILQRAAADPSVWTIKLLLFDGPIPKSGPNMDFALQEAAVLGQLHGVVLTVDQNGVVIGAEIYHNVLGETSGVLKLKRVRAYQVIAYKPPTLEGTVSTKQPKQTVQYYSYAPFFEPPDEIFPDEGSPAPVQHRYGYAANFKLPVEGSSAPGENPK